MMDVDINGLVTVRFEDGVLPVTSEQFAYWARERGTGNCDLEIVRGKVDPPHALRALKGFSFFEGGFVYKTENGKVEMRPERITIEGSVDEMRIETQFIRWAISQLIMRKGWCLAHASAVVYEGKGILLPAMGGTGKTSLMLEFMSRGAEFLGDDRVLISKEGDIALYPRWVHMSEYNWPIFPETFKNAFPDAKKRREQAKRLSKYRRGLHMKGGNPATRYLKNYYTSFFYSELSVKPELLFPGTKVALKAKADYAFFLERIDENPMVIEASPSRLARMLFGSTVLDSTGRLGALSVLAGLEYQDDRKRFEIMQGFFEHTRCREARIRSIRSRQDVVKVVDELIANID